MLFRHPLRLYLILSFNIQDGGYANETIEAAYNDNRGVTAKFNLNILSHLNHRFDGNFDLDRFKHLAFYNHRQHQIEMHLHSLVNQTVSLKALNYQFTVNAGETIHTEISRKFHYPIDKPFFDDRKPIQTLPHPHLTP